MAAFRFELVSPEGLVFSGGVESVIVPGTEGEFMVLENHTPLMSMLKPGVVTVEREGASQMRLFVHSGFADVSSDGLTLLAERAIPVEELDAARIDADIMNAEEDVNDAETDEGRRLALERLDQLREVKAALRI